MIMAKKSDPVSSASKARTIPFTPMRRFFLRLELLKPIVALGKRARDQSHSALADVHHLERKYSQAAMDPPPLGPSSFTATATATAEPGRIAAATALIKDQAHERTARIALQQHDQPLDAIVITTLPSYPFCCHEDLLMMSRSQLVEVVLLLNSRLPASSQIELADGVPDAHIRHSIETLVGIVPDIPGAPRAVKSRTFDTRRIGMIASPERDIIPSPPTSPLSMRVSRRQEKALPIMMTSPLHLLGRLEEEGEDENDVFTMKKPLKKRKMFTIAPIDDSSILDEDTEMEGTPTRPRYLRLPMIMESPTSFMNMGRASSPTVLKSKSQREIHGIEQSSPIPSPDVFRVDGAFVHMKTPYRSIGKNSTRKSGRKAGRRSHNQQQSSSSSRTIKKTNADNMKKRDYLEKQAITARMLSYRPFEIPASNSERYMVTLHTKPLTSTKSSGNSESSTDEKGVSFEEDRDKAWFGTKNTTISLVEYEDDQVAGGIENLSVGCALELTDLDDQMDTVE